MTSNPTFAGVETGTYSSGTDYDAVGTLDEEGTYSGGSFALTPVAYSGSATDSHHTSEGRAAAWTGDFSGSETYSYADAGSNSFTASAAGNFAAGSFSMS